MSFIQRRRFLWMCFLAGLVLLGLTAAFANGTTLARLRFEELAQQSSAQTFTSIVTGATDTSVLWSVNNVPGGNVSAVGGTSGHLHSHVDGVPIFRSGEEVYLFLWERPGEPYRVLGWAQGTFRIARNAETGNESVTQDSALLPLFDPRTRTFRHGGIRKLPLEIFQLKLRKALQQEN